MGVKERRLREKIRRKNEIIEAAETVIFEKGIQHASMNDIAKAAELGKATLYVYYKSKDEILLDINERAHQRLASSFREVANQQEKGIDKIRAIGQAYFQFAQDYPNYYRFIQFFEANELKVSQEEVAENGMKVDSILTQVIQEGIADGSVRSDFNPSALSKCLWAMATGMQQLMEHRGEVICQKFDLTEGDMYQTMFQVLERGLAVSDTSEVSDT
jgi:AcrR family transcriptional regulator